MSTKFWVYPHENTIDGDCILFASDVDEMDLVYEEGMTLADVQQVAFEAFLRQCPFQTDEHKEEHRVRASEITGAWIVPDLDGRLWPMIGAVRMTTQWSDSENYRVNEAIKRLVASLSVGNLGAEPADIEEMR